MLRSAFHGEWRRGHWGSVMFQIGSNTKWVEVYHQWKNAYFEDAWPVLIIFQVWPNEGNGVSCMTRCCSLRMLLDRFLGQQTRSKEFSVSQLRNVKTLSRSWTLLHQVNPLFYHNLSWFMFSVQNTTNKKRNLKESRQNSELVWIGL